MLEGEEKLKTLCIMSAIVHAGNCTIAAAEDSQLKLSDAVDEAKQLMGLAEKSMGYNGK